MLGAGSGGGEEREAGSWARIHVHLVYLVLRRTSPFHHHHHHILAFGLKKIMQHNAKMVRWFIKTKTEMQKNVFLRILGTL